MELQTCGAMAALREIYNRRLIQGNFASAAGKILRQQERQPEI
jgi:hypothetical protein